MVVKIFNISAFISEELILAIRCLNNKKTAIMNHDSR